LINKILFSVPVFIFSIGIAYAEPLYDVNSSIINFDGDQATVKMTWNADESTIKYNAGCVSCIPNISEFTTNNEIFLDNVTALPNNSFALLYVLAYDSNDDIISAKQIIINLVENK
jgi:hypothetical protein